MDELTRRVIANARNRGVVVLTHRQWGSKHPSTYVKRLTTHPVTVKKADTLWEHITVTFDSGKLVGDFKRDMQTLERIGDERFSSGVSYNFCIDHLSGMVGLGQFLTAKGTHTVNDKGIKGYSYNQNLVARAVAWIGMPGMKPSAKAIEAHAQLQAAMMEEEALTMLHDFVPHSLVAAKECPTQNVRDVMPAIRTRATDLLTKPVVLRTEVTKLREEITIFLSKPRTKAVTDALLNADAALAKIEVRR